MGYKIANFGGAVSASPYGHAQHKTCTRCPLHINANFNCVPPRGANNPHLMLVGEAPGPDEDRMGRPFVGRSGQHLDDLILRAQLNPLVIRWSNVARCFPKTPDGKFRPPTSQEAKICAWTHLYLEIAEQRPTMLMALGKVASVALTGSASGIERMRGYKHPFEFPDEFISWAEEQRGMILYEPDMERTGGMPPTKFNPKTCRSIQIPVIVTYHPAGALRKKSQKISGQIEQDLIYARKSIYQEPILPDVDYRLVRSLDELSQWEEFFIRGFESGMFSDLSFDLETGGPDDEAGLRPFDPRSEIITAQISWAPKCGIMIPVAHPEGGFNNSLGIAAIRQFFQRLFVEKGIPVIGQNIAFDYRWMYAKFGIRLKIVFDTLFAHQALFAGDEPNDLSYLSAKYLGVQGYEDKQKEEMAQLPKGKKTFGNLKLGPNLVTYGCGDVDMVSRLRPILTEELQREDLWWTYTNVYLPALIPMAEMEINGLPTDSDIYQWLRYQMPIDLEDLKMPVKRSKFYPAYLRKEGCPEEYIIPLLNGVAPKKIVKDYDFNPGSGPQLTRLLFDVMGLTKNPERVTDKGAPQTDKDALDELHENCLLNGWSEHAEIVKSIQEYKTLDKLHSSYIENLPKVVPNKGEPAHELFTPYMPYFVPWSCHPSFKMDGTQTGRCSASNPAIHNMPGSSAVKRLFRSRWRERGGLHLQLDYSAMEVRVLACRAMADDPILKEAFSKGFDAHKYVASLIFNISIDKVTKDQRKLCKTVNFAVLYGAGPENVAAQVGCTVAEAKNFIARYLGLLPATAAWRLKQQQSALTNGVVRSAFGRRRFLSTKVYSKGDIERRAVNTPVQSTASDVTLTSYIRVFWKMLEMKFQSLSYLFVHDSLGFDVYPGEFFDLYELLHYEMAIVPPQLYHWLDVPLEVESDCGFSWGTLVGLSRIDRQHWKLLDTKEHGTYCAAVICQLELAGHHLTYKIEEEVVDGKPASAYYLEVSR